MLGSSFPPGLALPSSGNPKQVLLDVGVQTRLAWGERLAWMTSLHPFLGGKLQPQAAIEASPMHSTPCSHRSPTPDPPQPWEPPAPAPAQTIQ